MSVERKRGCPEEWIRVDEKRVCTGGEEEGRDGLGTSPVSVVRDGSPPRVQFGSPGVSQELPPARWRGHIGSRGGTWEEVVRRMKEVTKEWVRSLALQEDVLRALFLAGGADPSRFEFMMDINVHRRYVIAQLERLKCNGVPLPTIGIQVHRFSETWSRVDVVDSLHRLYPEWAQLVVFVLSNAFGEEPAVQVTVLEGPGLAQFCLRDWLSLHGFLSVREIRLVDMGVGSNGRSFLFPIFS
uniref:Uncharacterized protein n=1 Tax=Compsopogon caeruleus TaxID=31354 RepID=A0A7S1T5M4_9RHOD